MLPSEQCVVEDCFRWGANVVKTWMSRRGKGLSSPANLMIAGLVGLLLVGYGTDWKILFGHPARPKPTARFGSTEIAVGAHRARHLRQGFTLKAEAEPNSEEVADNRSPTADR